MKDFVRRRRGQHCYAKMLPCRFESPKLSGEGTFGKVFFCHDKITDTRVAVKRFKDACDADGWNADTIRELTFLKCTAAASNIVSAHGVVRQEERLYSIMEPMDGTLYQRMKKQPMTQADLNGALNDILLGLDWLHRTSIMHRDLKLQNILVSRDGVCKLGDMGSARYVIPGREYTLMSCTPQFRALEVLLGDTHYDTSVDIWAVGCIVFEMVTSRMLFDGDGTRFGQTMKVFETIGIPSNASWDNVEQLSYYLDTKYEWPRWRAPVTRSVANCDGVLRVPISNCDKLSPMLSSMIGLCFRHPRQRPKASQLLSMLQKGLCTLPELVQSSTIVPVKKRATCQRLADSLLATWRNVGCKHAIQTMEHVNEQCNGDRDTLRHALALLYRVSQLVSPADDKQCKKFALTTLMIAHQLNEEYDAVIAWCDDRLGYPPRVMADCEIFILETLDWNASMTVRVYAEDLGDAKHDCKRQAVSVTQ